SSPTLALGGTTLTNAGDADVFVARLDGSSGAVLWADGFGGDQQETTGNIVGGVAVDAAGNTFVTGSFKSGTVAFGVTTLTNADTGSQDVFVAKLDGAGAVLWAESFGSTLDDRGQGIAVDQSGDAYVTGSFGAGGLAVPFGSITLKSAGGS